MIAFARSQSEWQAGSGRGSFHLSRMWAHLMGFELGGDLLREEPANGVFIAKMKSLYGLWADEWMGDSRTIRQFSAFCSTPAGCVLLPEALEWLAEAVGETVNHRHFSDAVGALVQVCGVCWQKHRRDLEHDAEFRGAFLSILASLARHQHPEGLQLQDEVLQSLKH